MEEGSAVQAGAYLFDYELALENRTEGKRWHRSKERLPVYMLQSANSIVSGNNVQCHHSAKTN